MTSADSKTAAAETPTTTTSTPTKYNTIEDLIGPTLYIKQMKKTKAGSSKTDDKKKKTTDAASLYTIEPSPTQSVLMKKKKPVEYVLLYFSASWCPPCQSFTPILADFYQKYHDTIEIIYISSDRNVQEFESYYCTKMPFATLHPYDPQASEVTTTLRQQLPHVFQITGIPTLVVLSIPPPPTTGTTTAAITATTNPGIRFVTDQGRIDLMNHPQQFDVVWKKWQSIPTSELLSIEEGVVQSKRGDGSIFSIISKLIQTLLQNPIYIFGIFYIYKYYGKSIYRMMVLTMNNSNSTTTATTDPSLLEPIPDDEF